MTMVNGCGPNWLPKKIKDLFFNWFFEASCNKHDRNYSKGKTELDRWKYDFIFLNCMLQDAKQQPKRQRLLAYSLAFIFYLTVVLFGWIQFKYSRRKKNDNPT